MIMNTRDDYGLIARLLHWLIAALVIGMLAGGSVLSFLPPGGFKGLFCATTNPSVSSFSC
jgi:cytochrome b561